MSITLYYILSSVLVVMVLLGIYLMSKVKMASLGNKISALAMLGGIIVTLIYTKVPIMDKPIFNIPILYIAMAIGLIVGLVFSARVKMIQMPQMVALLNGLGGAASAIVGAFSLMGIGADINAFSLATSALAVAVGMVTLLGSLIAAGKLHRVLPQKPIVLKGHQFYTTMSLVLTLAAIVLSSFPSFSPNYMWILLIANLILSSAFGVFFSIRVGGADMPITISLLNSLSGVAGAIAGLAIDNLLLVAVGGIVGASGLLLTQIMCKAINRSLLDILLGKSKKPANVAKAPAKTAVAETPATPVPAAPAKEDPVAILKNAKKVIIVPGYGMAIAQAQHLVKKLADKLIDNGTEVKYAIHPVAGRMPGHMNVLLCEANVDYEDLYEMKDVNDEFKDVDATIVVGANDVLNPAAREAVGTPIYGMPVLNVDQCKEIFIFNYDTKPGYAGVENPIYTRKNGVHLYLGNAAETLQSVLTGMDKVNAQATPVATAVEDNPVSVLKNAKKVMIVPGYGMAIAQAQHLVKKLADKLVDNGTEVKYAIHPVAGRMPGHMNVLLCEANVDYEDLYEMKDVNDEFKDVDATIVVGANDVLNPAAREAVGTPIYGMPVLNVDQCKEIFIFNYDTKPGYAGVENPIYTRDKGVHLYLGNAAETLQKVLTDMDKVEEVPATPVTPVSSVKSDPIKVLNNAKKVMIVPGYGMAIAQAQHLVKKLADKLVDNGTEVKYAIHPVAGRMPGHMNVLLCEANVDYEDLYEMKDVNDEFKDVDATIVVGANDVLNPAAREAVGTPIYGMPVLNVDQCKEIFIFNYDTKPGYAGVENPIYTRDKGVHLYLGNAAETLQEVISKIK